MGESPPVAVPAPDSSGLDSVGEKDGEPVLVGVPLDEEQLKAATGDATPKAVEKKVGT